MLLARGTRNAGAGRGRVPWVLAPLTRQSRPLLRLASDTSGRPQSNTPGRKPVPKMTGTKKRFFDKVRVTVTAGNGGSGANAWEMIGPNKMSPAGGNGGGGGHVKVRFLWEGETLQVGKVGSRGSRHVFAE